MSVSTPTELISLPGGGNVETARFVGIYTVCRDIEGRLAGMRGVCQEEIRHGWYSMKKRLFLLHDILNDLRDRKLVKTATVTVLLDNLLPLFSSTWRNLTVYSFWAPGKATALPELEAKLAKLEKWVKELLDQETQGPFEMALHKYHAQAIRAVIQSRIDLGEYNTVARLCLGAGAAGIVDDQLPTYELVLKVCKERAEVISNGNTSSETTISRTLKKLRSAPTTPSESTPLHAAVDKQLFHVIELLLVVYHVDPVVRNGNRGKRPIDVIGELSPDEKDDEDFKRIYFLLDQCTKAQEFQQLTTAVLGSQDMMTRESIVALTPNMTAVQDLQHVVDFKLVFNNDAAVYFKIGLEQCFAEGYLAKPELEHWILEMSKVNMEDAQWVAEIKQKIQSMQAQVALIKDNGHLLKTHFESLRQALIKKETQEKRKANIKMKFTMLTLGLTAVCGPVVKDLIKLALNAGVDKALMHCGVDPEKFADVLKQAVIFEHPEFAQAKSKPVETATHRLQPPSVLPGSRGREDEGENLTLTLQNYENQRLDDFSYHFAMQQSHGDFEEFLHLLDAADEDAHDANQAHDVIASAVDASTSSEFRISTGGERMVVTVNRARKVGNATRMA